jgi:diguanylate cyclase (GGDEF)-like protein
MLDAARRIGEGDFSGRVPVVGRDEMAGLATEFNHMSDRLERQIDQLRRQRTELDRSVARLGEAVASGLDQDALLGIVADTALGGCAAEYAAISLDDGTLIERPEGFRGPARVAVQAALTRSSADGTQVIARRETGHALAAPLARGGEVVGTFAVGRDGGEFGANDRDVFVLLLEKASTSIENVSAHELVSEQALTDELTGLANNRAFRETISREAARAERFGHELSLVILDVDDFKQVNDRHGHLQGDEVLRVIGTILQSEPRAIDEAARYGGEEFVVALPETGSEGAIELAERIRTRLEQEGIMAVDGGDPLRVTASFGTATLPDAAGNIRELFEAADEALYEAKRQGKNRVVTAPAAARSRQ